MRYSKKKEQITKNKETMVTISGKPHVYFGKACNWADDIAANMEASRNRWRAVTLYALIPATFLLLLSVTMLIPIQHLEPLLINHYSDGQVSVMPISKKHVPKQAAEIQSDIVRYIVSRESYSAFSYREQYTLVNLLSSGEVASQYINEQDSSNNHSPINVLGNKGTRTVHVTSVLFLDKAAENDPNKKVFNHTNLAQINFTVTSQDETGVLKTIPLTALVSWEYRGMRSNQTDAWQNWNGFTITHYDVQQRNLA